MNPIHATNLDANESVFFARQLESIKARSYDVVYPEFPATRLLPVSTDAGTGAESITYRQFDSVGLMKLIASYADDLPRSDVFGKEFTSPVRSFGGSYGYNVQEIRSAQMANIPLVQRKANAARQAWEQIVNKYAFFADGSAAFGGLFGLFYAPNKTVVAAPTGGWGSATPDQIIADINYAINRSRILSKGVEISDTVIMGITQFVKIASTPRASNSDTTILEFVRKTNPSVTFEGINECEGVTPKPSGAATATNILVAYRKSTDKMEFAIPQPYEQFPPQERGLEYIIATHGRIGGLILFYPLSVTVMEGL
jgi:hypothetical protein